MLYDFDHQDIEHLSMQSSPALGLVSDTTDEELMERIQLRDERALETLIKRFRPLVWNIVARQLHNDHDIADVVEEVFLGIWNQTVNFDPSKGKALGWIIIMARRRAIDRVRRCQAYDRARLRFSFSRETMYSHFAGENVEKAAMESETAAMFQELLSSLPKAQSAVVRMAYYRGLSHREMARETGIPLGTIKTRLELGVKKLRKAVCCIGSYEDWQSSATAMPERRTLFGIGGA
jgi:RNA polymerase sigma-70 factor (ECF subfamily)